MTTSLSFDIFARDRASDKFDKIGDSAEGAGAKFKKFGAVAAAGMAVAAVALVGGGKFVFDHGAKLEQMAMKADTVFGGQVGKVNKWAEANANAMGLSSREATGLAANFADLLIPMGFARKDAAKMATDVVGLSGALSQWSGGTKSAAEVTEILNSAMLGETDGLKALGISISAAEIEAQLLKKGQDKLTGSAKAQAEAQAIQSLIMAKSTDAQKAYAAGGSPLLAAQAKLKGMFADIRDELVMKLVPVMGTAATFASEKLGPALAQAGDWIKTNLLPPIKDFIAEVKSGEGVGGKFADAFQTAADVLGTLATFVNENRAAVGTFLGVIGTVIAVTKTWALAQAALNLVMTANPIGIAVVAIAALAGGLVYAYKKSETFRTVVDGAMDGVKTAFKLVGKAFEWVWANAIQPVMDFIGDTIRNVIEKIAAMLDALGKAPGMGWAKDAAAKLRGAAEQGERLGNAVRNIPTTKSITVSFLYKGGGKLKGSPAQFGDDPNDPLMQMVSPRGAAGFSARSMKSTGQLAMEAFAKGIKGGSKKVRETLGELRDSLKSRLDAIKADMASLSSSIASAFNKDVFGGTLAEMVSGLQGNGAGLQQMLAAFDKLKGMGASSSFLSSLFQSGNTGLVNELANSDAATVSGASGAFDANASMALSLGDKVALDAIGPQVGQAVAQEISKLQQQINDSPKKMAKELREVFKELQLVIVGGNAGQRAYLMTGQR